MAINKKLIHFKNKENFDNEVANGNILDNSIVFIQDSKEISTHGTVYKTVNWSVLEPELYEWVDLGLPSGTLWADRNVGATKPEEYGLYFAWGETQGYTAEDVENDVKQFNWSDYELCNGSSSTLTKYNTQSSYGTVDNMLELESSDDAAYQSDKTCRMPTKDEYEELIDNTTSAFTEVNGISGIRFASKVEGYTDKSIFIPAAGWVSDGSLLNVGSYGYIWSSSLYSDNPRNAHFMYFSSSRVRMNGNVRSYGYSVRPVKSNN